MAWRDAVMTGGRIRLKHSKTSGETLGADGLENGEIALQAAEGLLYYKDADGNIQDAAIAGAPADGNTYGRKDGAWVDLASAAALQFRQGTDAERLAMDPVPASGEPIYTTDTNRFFIGDGTTTGGRGIVTDSDTYVICQPGDDLLAKYTAAKALTPGGNAKSATNRAALIIYPGEYDIGDQTLTIDTDYVDVIGLGAARWAPSVFISSTATAQISFGGTDVRVVGLSSALSSAAVGGTKRIVANCGGQNFYSMDYTHSGDVPEVFGGHLIGCVDVLDRSITRFFCSNANGPMSTTTSNIFNGIIEDCYISNYFCAGMIFQGIIRKSTLRTFGGSGSFLGALQGRFEHCSFPDYTGALPALSAVSNSVPAAYTATCTISNATPAVVTKSAHGLYSGMKIEFTTDGALPTGLSESTVYYVQRIDANTFNVATTVDGTPVATSSAGSGTHTIAKPSDKEGGWYSYCALKDADFTST